MDIVKTGSTWMLRTAPILDSTGARLTGLTDIKFSVSRYTSGAWQWLDFADMTFKASPGTLQATMTEVDATKAAGVYAYALDTSTITNATLGDQLFVDIQQTTLTNAINANQAGGGVYGYVVDKVEANLTVATSTLATSASLATAQSDITTIKNYGAPPSAATISTQVGTDLSSAHGAGSWATATGFAVPGDAMTLTVGERDAVQAKILDDATPFHGASIATLVAYGAPPSAVTVSAAVVDQALAGHTAAGTVGEALSHADVATSTRLATSGYTAPPSAVTISTQVNDDLTTAHGAGSYQTASTAGLATATNVTDAVAAIEAYGDIHWLTAAGFAIPGSAMNLVDDAITVAKIAAGAIGASEAPLLAHLDADVSSRLAAASYTVPPTAAANAAAVWATVESTGVDGTMGGSLWKTRRRLTQRASTSVLGVVTLYEDDNVTPETTFTLTDVDGNAVTIVAGDPARRSAET